MAAWRVEGRTDGLGEATIAGLPAGPAFLEVREPGLVWTRVPVDLQAFAPAALRVDEPKGRTVRIRVRGDDGVSLAGASVRVRPDCGVAHAFVEDGVQVLGRFTDGTGECAVPGVPDGGARIWAEWGCRFETASVAPDTSEIEVVLSRRD